MTPQDRRTSRLARSAKRVGPSLVVAIPAMAAVALGVMFVMPALAASGTTGQAASVWAGPVTPRPSVATPAVQSSATIPEPSPSVTVAPTVAAPASTPAKKTTTAPAKATVTKTTVTKSTVVKPARAKTTAAPTGPLAVTVNTAGGQAQIDACKGPILWEGDVIAQHNTCGGTQFYSLKVGSLVTLAGTVVTPGTYKVISITDIAVGATYVSPHPYAIQTCISLGQARMWYLQPV